MKCWGANDYGQLGLGDTVVRGLTDNSMGDALLPINLGSGLGISSIATGNFHHCVLLNNNTIKCWGYNQFGQLGLEDTANRGDQPGEMGDSLPAVSQ
ncbi:MAG: hypothetical protein HY537_15980 [Deltaproteobacteria bacterium]|nr:hypothetical protein [Deltaproteobacteria bacterium]